MPERSHPEAGRLGFQLTRCTATRGSGNSRTATPTSPSAGSTASAFFAVASSGGSERNVITPSALGADSCAGWRLRVIVSGLSPEGAVWDGRESAPGRGSRWSATPVGPRFPWACRDSDGHMGGGKARLERR